MFFEQNPENQTKNLEIQITEKSRKSPNKNFYFFFYLDFRFVNFRFPRHPILIILEIETRNPNKKVSNPNEKQFLSGFVDLKLSNLANQTKKSQILQKIKNSEIKTKTIKFCNFSTEQNRRSYKNTF
jgi:hypothetical protein